MATEAVFKAICDRALMAIIVFDSTSEISTYCNTLAFEALNIPDSEREKPLALSFLFPEKDRPPYKSFSRELLQDSGFFQDLVMQKNMGHYLIANVGIRILENGKYFLVMFQDVTFQKKLQREIKVKQTTLMQTLEEITRQNDELKSLDIAKNKFIQLSTHELRTPVSGILATADSLKNGLIGEKELPSFCDSIYNEALHLMKIVNNLLDITKLDSGNMPLYVGQYDLAAISTTEIEKLELKAKTKNIELLQNFPEQAMAYIDKDRFIQVFTNVLDNAIKFSPMNSSVEITIHPMNEDKITVEIKDYGEGISKKHRNKIFSSFETTGDIETHHQGTGLGLPISKKLMEFMGGNLYFESEVNEYTSFFISAPTEKVLSEEKYNEDPNMDLLDLIESI